MTQPIHDIVNDFDKGRTILAICKRYAQDTKATAELGIGAGLDHQVVQTQIRHLFNFIAVVHRQMSPMNDMEDIIRGHAEDIRQKVYNCIEDDFIPHNGCYKIGFLNKVRTTMDDIVDIVNKAENGIVDDYATRVEERVKSNA